MRKIAFLFVLLLCMIFSVGCSHEHKFGDWETITEATCLGEGTKQRACTCGETETQTIRMLGHDYSWEWTVDVEATCSKNGSKSHHCSRCGDKTDITEIKVFVAHVYGKWEETKAPTCTEKGETQRHCINCDYFMTSTIAAKGHNWGVWVESKAPSCKETGQKTRTCSDCGDVHTETLNALGHTNSAVIIENKIDETCVKNGSYDSVVYCSVCGKEVTRKKEVIVAKHKYTAVITPPTVKDQGYTTYSCSACGNSYKDTYIPATGSLGLQYTVNADRKTCTVTGIGSCSDKELYINEKIDGYTVTNIGEKAFENQSQLTFIKIPSTVKTIGTRAFYGCTGLTEIEIPASVTSIGTQIFYKASNLKTVYYNSTYASSDNPFLNISNIEKIVFGGTKVPSKMLYNFTNIKQVEIKDTVKSIGSSAFEGCRGLTNVTIGNSVTSIGSYAFLGCYAMKELHISSIEAWCKASLSPYHSHPFCSSSGNIYINGEKLTELVIPDSVTSIGYGAFDGCSGLTSIEIPDSVTSIGGSAFSGCRGLTSIVIPDSVTSIGDYAFFRCTGLTSIEIPDSVTSIGGSAFSGCSGLTSIVIPDSVMKIEDHAFEFCLGLTSVYYGGTASDWSEIYKGSFNSCLTNATRYYYSETEPTEDGNYWHYVDGVPTAW